MKNYALITIHRAINQGAALQALATQYAFEREGINIRIIDYYPEFSKEDNETIRKDRGFAIRVLDTFHYRTRRLKIKKFAQFRGKYFHLSGSIDCEQNIKDELLDCEGVVIGSDQVWNPNVMGGKLDSVYFAVCATDDIRVISYASSMGDNINFGEKLTQEMGETLQKFSSISLREESGVVWLKENLGIEATRVLDPTLLLSKEEWSFAMEETKKVIKKPYIFIYSVGRTKDLIKYAKKVQKVLGYKIIVCGSVFKYPFRNTKYIFDDCPSDFLQLIKNASLVITSSFHGTAFSMNFNVPFLSLPVKKSKKTRASEFLKLVGLQKQFIDYDSDFNMSMLKIDWDKANEKLSKLRKESIEYICNATK